MGLGGASLPRLPPCSGSRRWCGHGPHPPGGFSKAPLLAGSEREQCLFLLSLQNKGGGGGGAGGVTVSHCGSFRCPDGPHWFPSNYSVNSPPTQSIGLLSEEAFSSLLEPEGDTQ